MQQTEIIDMLLPNSPLYGTGSFCVLMRRPWMGGKARGKAETEDERLEKTEDGGRSLPKERFNVPLSIQV